MGPVKNESFNMLGMCLSNCMSDTHSLAFKFQIMLIIPYAFTIDR